MQAAQASYLCKNAGCCGPVFQQAGQPLMTVAIQGNSQIPHPEKE